MFLLGEAQTLECAMLTQFFDPFEYLCALGDGEMLEFYAIWLSTSEEHVRIMQSDFEFLQVGWQKLTDDAAIAVFQVPDRVLRGSSAPALEA
jgi:hypothetical protein